MRVRPIDFARELLSGYPPMYRDEKRVKEIADKILDQLIAHVDKFTHFPRSRLNKKEEEII